MENQNMPPPLLRRVATLGGLVVLVFALFAVRLYDIQVVNHETYRELAKQSGEVTLPIAAARGEILDRHLRPMAANAVAYEVVFDALYFPKTDEGQNHVIATLCDLLNERREKWNDTLPISHTLPFTFDSTRENSVAVLKTALHLSDTATADECVAALSKKYALTGYSAAVQRQLAGVRYEMTLRQFSPRHAFVFATVAKETSYRITENTPLFQGVTVQAAARRDYTAGTAAVHLLGTVGPIYAEEYTVLKTQGYQLNETLGKSGAEAAFEPYLRGVSGKRVLRKNSQGTATEAVEEVSPVPGDTVVLTLDLSLQTAAQNALDNEILALRALPSTSRGMFLNNGHDVASGAVVVLDVTDGGVLTAASWPSYNPVTYHEDYASLLNDPDRPLFNRALFGTFACGSTMKPAVALAALTEGVITPENTVVCNGQYTRFSASGLILHCMGRHGRLRVTGALQRSCNVFFYDVSEKVGIDAMNRYASLCGLGEKTGIEVGEAGGVLAGPAFREAAGGRWSAADTAGAAIGQSDNLFTPLQLATYAMTLANGGVRYKTHLFHSRLSYDGRVKETYQPQIASRGSFSQEAIDVVREGMVAVATDGTAASYFRRADYTLACKTGTAQVAKNRSDHGVFIAYAPVEAPRVAVAVVMENGTSAVSLRVARAVLDAYFEDK